MIREKLILGEHIYNCEYYEESMNESSDQKTYKKFVMLRNFKIVDTIMIDTDILFIEKEILDKMRETYKKDKHEFDIYCLPVLESIQAYSKDIFEFNDLFTENSIYDKKGYGDDVYEFYDENGKETLLLCDKIKIYHPITNNISKSIVHVYNTIGGINFHYVCRKYDTYKSKSETEINIDNQTYSEYIELYIPNVHYIFDEISKNKYNVYYKENLGMIVSTANENFLNSNIIYINNDIQLIPLSLIIQPFRIIDEIDTDTGEIIKVKQYLKLHKSIENNYLTYPIHLTMFPYSEYNENINHYIINDKISSATIVFSNEYRFSLANHIGFSNGIVSTISEFYYPEKTKYIKKYNGNTNKALVEAYKYFNDVTDEDYIRYAELNKYISETPEDILDEEGLLENNLDKVERDEYYEENEMPSDFIGFQIKIATDLNFRHVIYIKNKKVKLNELDDFSFNLNGLFTSWDELNDYIIVIITFVDNYLGISIPGNFVIITKEYFKYMITDNNIFTVSALVNENKKFIKKDMKELDLKNGVNFINNITCILNKKDDGNVKNLSHTNIPRILYRPIFYRVNDLQNINIRENIVQNIGINLVEYMTKVNAFKIVISGQEFMEVGRNDIYVIFRLDANKINSLSGKYDIFTDEDEYISTGTYKKY